MVQKRSAYRERLGRAFHTNESLIEKIAFVM